MILARIFHRRNCIAIVSRGAGDIEKKAKGELIDVYSKYSISEKEGSPNL